ncbi:MAG: hypothetical protein H8D45_18130 [Bacteroidetes bacterium]|nr:hypothetical protein [Bacteroidota bacterium]MBL7103287.1 hypothetical protein [Bacteroidales bacterium]
MAKKKISQDEIFKKTDSAFNQMDQQRAEGLEKTRSIQAIKNRLLKREQERLKRKYGNEHPRVKKISNRLAYNQGFFKELDIELDRTKIELPLYDTDSWMVHGRVIGENDKGINNLTVSIYDEKGTWVRKINYTCTNELGYFSIMYPPKGGKPEISENQKLFLTILDKEHKILHQETEPLYVKVGQIDYREIILSKKKDTCSPPEANNEKSSLPPDAWVVRGKVTDEMNQGMQGLTISLYDKDLLFDDVLGTTLTDENGNFKIIYRTEAFKDLFEKKPDVYLKVLEEKGRKLYSSRRMIRCQAGFEEYFTIKIKRRK